MSDEPQPQAHQPNEGGPGGGPGGGKAKRPKRTGWRRVIPTWRMVLGTFVTGLLLLGGLFFLGYSLVKIPPANALAIKQSNVFLYADGTQLARDGEVNRENVTLAQISKDAQHAVLAAEDRDFYSESAVDPKAMVRAAWNTATGKGKQSGSTITQQYVKNYYLAQEQTLTRKAKEFFIAIKLDREDVQGRDPPGLPQHQLLRPQRLRHPGRRPGLLRRRRHRTRRRQGRLPRRAAERAQRVRRRRPPGEPQVRRGPLELRPGRHGQGELAERVRAGRA
ncbi:Biosynthetic peptidoglycan transglycosylase [Streptomyces glaucescens]